MSRLAPLAKKGYQLIEALFTPDEVAELKAECDRLVAMFDPEQDERSVFNPDKGKIVSPNVSPLIVVVVLLDRKSDRYFLESAHKIRYFYEKDAFDADGKLQVDIKYAFNKIGHALHWHNDVFKKFTFGSRFGDIARELGMLDPVIVQSMVIFKNPSIGGEVPPHQDASYLHAVPTPEGAVFGFWIPMEDATTENGCLEFVNGSHKTCPLATKWQRVSDGDGQVRMEHSNPDFSYSGQFVPCPAPKGSVVLIDGLVVHRSSPNRSEKPRPIYTFHVFDQGRPCRWDERNWLQPTTELAFPSLYHP